MEGYEFTCNWVLFIKGRMKQLPREIDINLWYELVANHPHILKIESTPEIIPGWDVKAPENYKSPINSYTGKKYPECCEFHKGALREVDKCYYEVSNAPVIQDVIDGFVSISKRKCSAIANKVVRQVIFTEYHILKHITYSDWYEKITDYIEANIASFGRMPYGNGSPVGLEHYLNYLKQALTDERSCLKASTLTKERVERLCFFLDFYHPDKRIEKNRMLDLCFIYRKWLETFPFEITYFKKFQEHYRARFPVYENVRFNPYLT